MQTVSREHGDIVFLISNWGTERVGGGGALITLSFDFDAIEILKFLSCHLFAEIMPI